MFDYQELQVLQQKCGSQEKSENTNKRKTPKGKARLIS